MSFRDGKCSFILLSDLKINSETIKPFIEGVSGNKSVGYTTRELANAAFSNALKQGKVMLIEQ